MPSHTSEDCLAWSSHFSLFSWCPSMNIGMNCSWAKPSPSETKTRPRKKTFIFACTWSMCCTIGWKMSSAVSRTGRIASKSKWLEMRPTSISTSGFCWKGLVTLSNWAKPKRPIVKISAPWSQETKTLKKWVRKGESWTTTIKSLKANRLWPWKPWIWWPTPPISQSYRILILYNKVVKNFLWNHATVRKSWNQCWKSLRVTFNLEEYSWIKMT